ncbi:MAG TPA: hypothetical protein VK436_04340 [Methanocella sp.]|nr:hypothetical protein [Methanocella sp.]
MINKKFESGFMIPILPGKTDETRKFWEELSNARAHEIDEYARNVGQSRLLVYLQHLPRGDFLVQYIQSDVDVATSFKRNLEQHSPIAKHIQRAFMDIARYDFTRPENAPNIEKIYEWSAHEETGLGGQARKCFIFAFPLLSGKADEFWHQFESRQSNQTIVEGKYRDQGILRLVEFLQDLQHRPGGLYAVSYLESYDDLRTVFSRAPNDVRQFWLDTSGIDLANPRGLPDLELLFEWNDSSGIRTSEAQKAYTI